jgi:hypothetical protein
MVLLTLTGNHVFFPMPSYRGMGNPVPPVQVAWEIIQIRQSWLVSEIDDTTAPPCGLATGSENRLVAGMKTCGSRLDFDKNIEHPTPDIQHPVVLC